MFCNQCEQTAQETACLISGSCGKTPEVDTLQDLLTYALQGLAHMSLQARKIGFKSSAADRFTLKAMFATLTNVNFDAEDFDCFIEDAVEYREEVKTGILGVWPLIEYDSPSMTFLPARTRETRLMQGRAVEMVPERENSVDIFSMKMTVLYGLRGVCAYAFHALQLGQEDDRIYTFVYEGLAALEREDLSLQDWIHLAMKVGEHNLIAMELLDRGHTTTLGHPIPTDVPLGHRKGKAILVSGHDLHELEALLQQTAGLGIDIYTHGEMLPAHGYPNLKKYPHLYGHYGTAWQNQQKEFAGFPGPIVMTSNCLIKPQPSYQDHLYTAGPAGWPEMPHISNRNFKAVIQKALAMPGFESDAPVDSVTTGFARNAMLGVADKVIEAVQSGKLRHFFLVGGCDGAKPGRHYYSEFVAKMPEDCVVLTLGCGKFRFFDQQLGDIDGIPRYIDLGQCNDAYSALQIALALSKAFDVPVNQLPLSMIISWFEQKAVSVFLTLLYLGIKDIYLGPTLPAFITPNVLKYLVDNFNVHPLGIVEEDMAACLAKTA